MATDRKVKKKKKREEKKKLQRQSEQRAVRAEKADDFYWNMVDAYHERDYATALKCAIKRLKLTPADSRAREVAIYCADQVNDREALYTLLQQSWQQKQLSNKQNFFALGHMAMSRRDFELARDVFQSIIEGDRRALGYVFKKDIKEAKKYMLYAESMLQAEAMRAALDSAHHQQQPQPRQDSKPPQKQDRAAQPKTACEENLPQLNIAFRLDQALLAQAIQDQQRTDYHKFQLALSGYRLSFRSSYDQLICLPGLRNVQSLWYQQETARKVMKTFRGRAILADEVGLGKTIEAGLIVKEYVMRGLVRSTLILTPSSLVNQWQDEMANKFDLQFISSNDPLCRQDTESFWNQPFIIASIHTAKTKRHFDSVTRRSYDMVIVDEAHHLKNRTTLNWKLVNAIQKTFLLMLTATPVQNSLEELYNLVTLLRPGHLKTVKAFKEEYVARGNPTDPQNRERLKTLLKEVMVRNTRSVTQLQLPPRYAYTVRVTPTPAEELFYSKISQLVIQQAPRATGASKLRLRKLLETAGSSHAAALKMIDNTTAAGWNGAGRQIEELVEIGKAIGPGNKTRKVVELLRASVEQKILFVNHIGTLEHLQQILEREKIQHVVFHGSLGTGQKQSVIKAFEAGCQVLLATGTGGEGFNLQFCQTMINFDLPWNPMAIEQRIGRIHRIGQEKEVHIYNFCAAGSIEDHILEVLDRKINMFELVVGEIDMILGRIRGEEEFSDMVYEIWLQHPDEAEKQKAFAALAAKLKRAQSAHVKSKELDEKLFQEDFGI